MLGKLYNGYDCNVYVSRYLIQPIQLFALLLKVDIIEHYKDILALILFLLLCLIVYQLTYFFIYEAAVEATILIYELEGLVILHLKSIREEDDAIIVE